VRLKAVVTVTDKRIVLTTAGSEDEARKIANHLVENRLAACVNLIARAESIYRWQGKVESSTEWLLLIKTTAQRFPAVRNAIGELHSYELPECVVLSVEDGGADYLKWLEEAVQPTHSPAPTS
jgi:periplasmic divalent cation tolerance protein